ncbi:MAG: hypothetical protein GQ574_25170 [Crocinitomix sp.]|nr:hypothetical protein [Crocinitomix sp.]
MKILLLLLLISTVIVGNSQSTESPKSGFKLEINSPFTYRMLEPNQNLRKVSVLMEEKEAGNLDGSKLIIGTSLIAIGDYQVSNTDSKFAYLMRHPTSSNQIGNVVTEAVVHSFQVSLTGNVTNWLSSHAEILYNPEQSFGTGLITDLARNQLQLRKGFVVIGDLRKFPVYGAIGKMDSPFGQMGSVSPFTNSTMWHAFGGLCYGAQVSFKKWNIHATLMAAQGGAQFRGMTTIVGDTTNVPSLVNNFTADLNYTVNFAENISFKFGGSYLHGSTYNHSFPVKHFEPGVENNPAVTTYGMFNYKDRIIVKTSYAKTLKVWEGTHNPTAPLNQFEAFRVSSFDAGASYLFNPTKNIQYTASFEFSDFVAGPNGAPWERQNQYILGFSALINQSSKLFVEGFRTDGYAPLNWISGSNDFDPFPPGVTHSQANVQSYGLVVGCQITF